MTAYEERLLSIYNSRTIEDLRLMLKDRSQRAADATNQFNATGLSKYKEDKEHHAHGCDVLRFVIANREFYDVDTVINEVN
jgi:hypothetical protein